MSRLTAAVVLVASVLSVGATNDQGLPGGNVGAGVGVAVEMCINTTPRVCGPVKVKLKAKVEKRQKAKPWPKILKAAGVVTGPSIKCPPTCDTLAATDQTITLKAEAHNDRTNGQYDFVGWEDQPGCSAATTCSFKAAAGTSVTAVFKLKAGGAYPPFSTSS